MDRSMGDGKRIDFGNKLGNSSTQHHSHQEDVEDNIQEADTQVEGSISLVSEVSPFCIIICDYL